VADLKMRPRFTVDARCSAKTLAAELAKHIADAEPPLEGHFDPAHCVLRIAKNRRYFWSPELDLTFDALDSGDEVGDGVRVRCLFTPRPAVWTAFAFVYSVISVAGLAGGLFGAAQLSLGRSPWALWVPVAAAAVIGAVYGATFIGQGLAATQMYELRRYLDEGLERAEALARSTPRTPFDSAQL
jgi:hypothetical protein